MRITTNEIKSQMEMLVNSLYDSDENDGWLNATLDQWVNAVYEEVCSEKIVNYGGWQTIYQSNENRFDGKEELLNKIKPIVVERLERLKKEGYNIKAIEKPKLEEYRCDFLKRYCKNR